MIYFTLHNSTAYSPAIQGCNCSSSAAGLRALLPRKAELCPLPTRDCRLVRAAFCVPSSFKRRSLPSLFGNLLNTLEAEAAAADQAEIKLFQIATGRQLHRTALIYLPEAGESSRSATDRASGPSKLAGYNAYDQQGDENDDVPPNNGWRDGLTDAQQEALLRDAQEWMALRSLTDQMGSFIVPHHQELDGFASIVLIKNIPSVDYCYTEICATYPPNLISRDESAGLCYKAIRIAYPPSLPSRDESVDPVCHKHSDRGPGVSYHYKGICVAYRPKLSSPEESADNMYFYGDVTINYNDYGGGAGGGRGGRGGRGALGPGGSRGDHSGSVAAAAAGAAGVIWREDVVPGGYISAGVQAARDLRRTPVEQLTPAERMEEAYNLMANIREAQQAIQSSTARLQELGFAPNLGGGLGALPAPAGESSQAGWPAAATTGRVTV
ncbi:hypothetical protein CNMCM5793_000863 [Aspergillus hiratsukae]|uniref:Uncharacterized protein n=1 Tax=Aspergillus hiratsukae TaxID=1194566 RepID=A0A8H6URH9_9EURO|nr:hypothetical protein CNMCM5793_000863 [Aspergillus hiratsukae]KAF7163105.1 hypothetical protein CNMCM6106_000137 [Aspergillus hiratsukae]